MRILLTGFEPFGKLETNPSQHIVDRLASAGPDSRGTMDLVTEVLPTAYAAAGERIRTLIRGIQPGAVICLGVAVRADALHLERVALNLDDAEAPDNAGDARAGQRIISSGPVGYWSTLPLAEMFLALQAREIPVRISNHAGTYVCNHVFYTARHEVERLGSDAPCGLVHVPLMQEQAATEEDLKRSLPLETMVEAVSCCLAVVGA
jgi:pyroglutamyl-peptidase